MNILTENTFVLVVAILFLLLWGLFLFVFSFLSGWLSLGRKYKISNNHLSKRAHLVFSYTLMKRFFNYGYFIKIGLQPEGLFLQVLFPFRIGHPSLLIPWNDIVAENNFKFMIMDYVQLNFVKEPGLNLCIPIKFAQKIYLQSYINIPKN